MRGLYSFCRPALRSVQSTTDRINCYFLQFYSKAMQSSKSSHHYRRPSLAYKTRGVHPALWRYTAHPAPPADDGLITPKHCSLCYSLFSETNVLESLFFHFSYFCTLLVYKMEGEKKRILYRIPCGVE